MAILRWLVSAVLGPLLDGLAGMVRDKRARDDAVGLGQAQQKVADQDEGLKAAERLQQAAAEPKGREVTQKGLDDGRF